MRPRRMRCGRERPRPHPPERHDPRRSGDPSADPRSVGLAPGADRSGASVPRPFGGGAPLRERFRTSPEARGGVRDQRGARGRTGDPRSPGGEPRGGGPPPLDRSRRTTGAVRRPFDGQPVAAEEQQVEIELGAGPSAGASGDRSRARGLSARRGGSLRRWPGLDRGARRAPPLRSGSRADGSPRPPWSGRGARRHGGERRAGRPGPPRRRSAFGARRRGYPEPDVSPNPATHRDLDRASSPSRLQSPSAARGGPNPAPAARRGCRHPDTPRRDSPLIAANELALRFRAGGADDVRVVRGSPDGRSFGERLRGLTREVDAGAGLIVLGSGSIPLATDADVGLLVDSPAPGSSEPSRTTADSSDVIAIGDARILTIVPDLPADNVLPRWLEAVAGLHR